MALPIALMHGTAEDVAAALGRDVPLPRRPLTPFPLPNAVAPSAYRDALEDRLPQLAVVADGTLCGEIHFRRPSSSNGPIDGSVAELLLMACGAGTDAWLPPALKKVESYVRQVGAIAALVVRPLAANGVNGGLAAALAGAGYVGETDGVYRRELVAPYWRRGGVVIIAEAGSNWRMGSPERDLAMAQALINVAAEAGADAVKFQTFRPETVYVAEAGASDYLSDAGITQSIRDVFADIAMPYDMLPKLAEYARSRGIAFMSTAFSPADFAAVDPLVTVHKIASYEISHVRLIELAARSGKPTVMSTGAATLDDIAWAVDHYHRSGGKDLCLMQCTAKYPAPLDSLNLAAIPELERMFGVSVGLSDHSRESTIGPLAATALGARVIEKHFTLDNRLPGPDHPFAVTPSELADLVVAVRAASASRGHGIKHVLDAEMELAAFAQRGLQAIAEIKPGDVMAENGNIAILRPGKRSKGIHPRNLSRLEGKRAARPVKSGEGIREGDWTE
jgi:N-acetylneuraminate synthase